MLTRPPPLPEVDGVEFRPVSSFPGYAVGSNGTVWSSRRHSRWLPLQPRRTGRKRHPYYAVQLYRDDGSRAQVKLHVLVLTEFVGPRPEGCWGLHYPDPDTANNAVSNLMWGTPAVNNSHCVQQGRHKAPRLCGEKHGHSLLTASDAREIHRLLSSGSTVPEMAKRFQVSYSAIMGIASGTTWASLDLPVLNLSANVCRTGSDNPAVKLDSEKVSKIREQYLAGAKQVELARQYGVSQVLISQIVLHKIWR